MQTITQSVVESHTKLVYKYIKQDVEAENNHTAKGRVEQMGTPTECNLTEYLTKRTF